MSSVYTSDVQMVVLSRMLYVEDDFRKLFKVSLLLVCIKTVVMSIQWTQWVILRVAHIHH